MAEVCSFPVAAETIIGASSSELAQSGARNMVSAATRLLGFVDTGRVIHDKSLTNYDSSCFEGNTLTSNDIRWLHHIKTIGAAGILRGELYDRSKVFHCRL